MNANFENAKTIQEELKWFQNVVDTRFKNYFEGQKIDILDVQPPSVEHQTSDYANCINEHKMNIEERAVLILSLIPHVKPSFLDFFFTKNKMYDVPYSEFGGLKHPMHNGFLPTGETVLFLLGGTNIEKRFELMKLFDKKHFFHLNSILFLEKSSSTEPFFSRQLLLSQEYLALFISGKKHKPDFSPHFPAKRIFTTYEWKDLVFSEHLTNGLDEIKNYILHGKKLKNKFQFGKQIKSGFKVLFTGPPGTGKTLTASWLGKEYKKDVYKVDLSMVVSKYIGETEKNLSRVFDLAESKDWILFFDEADALFGKRSTTSDSHDRYANQEVSFLLQRIEDFDGLVILCSNFKRNIDEAFFRRFQLVLNFEIPDVNQRRILWDKSKTEDFEYHKNVDIEYLSENYELTAASIVNILHYSILKCLNRKDGEDRIITINDINAGIRIEKIKQGKSIV
ncbi:ATP-binding protein [Urechidicola croceus]|uniref:AAA family ATPase n=1 Tax=Urechidicola croceus TaxID=1850246 RepID=A0A1D8P816_9FLAO|nr:ATP-binding protein [Urechidicola croceus]AOW20716.1 AAA family ATPase [Urechidicola croceus]